MKSLFAYGTLMAEAIFTHVTRLQISGTAASLKGYRRYAIRGEFYPAIIPDTTGQVEGVIYQGIPAVVWDRLDEYEGRMYQRRSVTVVLAEQRGVTAEAYVLRPIYARRLSAQDWDFGRFLQQHKSRYVRALR